LARRVAARQPRVRFSARHPEKEKKGATEKERLIIDNANSAKLLLLLLFSNKLL